MRLIELLPIVKRARDYYLYDERGERILDLYLDDGRAINGHRPNGLSLALKNAIERGLYAPYPSIYSDRLLKLLRIEFPLFQNIGIYKSFSSFSELYGGDIVISDPLEDNSSAYQLWRPYLPVAESCRLLVLRFPFPGSEAVAVLSFEDLPLPGSDILPPFILSGLIRSFFDFKNRFDKVSGKNWDALDKTGHWKRTGPYLKPQCSSEEYEVLFRFYLENGILISPDYSKPSIFVVQIREGSLKKLYKNLKGG